MIIPLNAFPPLPSTSYLPCLFDVVLSVFAGNNHNLTKRNTNGTETFNHYSWSNIHVASRGTTPVTAL